MLAREFRRSRTVNHRQRLRGEGLVDLDQVGIVE